MSKRILIVDDDVLLSETIGNYLSLLQYQVFFADNTDEAITYIHHHQPELVICECHTLNVNGYEILKIIMRGIENLK